MRESNDSNINSQQNLEISNQNPDLALQCCTSCLVMREDVKIEQKQLREEEEEELRRLLFPNVEELSRTPPSAIDANFTTFFAPDFMKPEHDQYVHRHANGLCVIGLAPHHVAFKDKGGIVSVDFNVGKSDRSGIKVTGKRKKFCDSNVLSLPREVPSAIYCSVCYQEKGLTATENHGIASLDDWMDCKERAISQLELMSHYTLTDLILMIVLSQNAQHFESNTALCKVCTGNASYIARCCVKGSLLEVNERLIKQPELLNTMPEREGYIAIIMPKPADWLKAKASLMDFEEYKKMRAEQ